MSKKDYVMLARVVGYLEQAYPENVPIAVLIETLMESLYFHNKKFDNEKFLKEMKVK